MVALAVALVLVAVLANGADAADEFTDQPVLSGFRSAVSMDFLPDGRVLVAGKAGEVYLGDPATGQQSLYLTVPNVESNGERGLLDILVAPDFADNGYFYVYYSVAPSTQLRIDRYRFTGNKSADAGTRTTLWANPGPVHAEFGEYHIGGSLNIGPDNMFYLSVGDGFRSANSASFTNVFGKILRIRRDGTIPSNNPFADGSGPNVDEIWAYGVRNPWRASFDEATGRYLIADVGGNVAERAYEELNIGAAGANYGWPTCEGPLGQPKNGPVCPTGVTGPVHSYAHINGTACCRNSSITGGEVFRSDRLPESLRGAYIYGDFARQEIRSLRFEANGSVTDARTLLTLTERRPTWIGQGPDGHIYYVHFSYTGNQSEVRRIVYNGSADRPPTITAASATPTSGTAPLRVEFTGTATDPDGDSLSYRWTFGDGDSSTSRTPAHTYATAGRFVATLTVSAGGQSVRSDEIVIDVGQGPSARIANPANGSVFVAGKTILLVAESSDDQPLGESSHRWDIGFVHDDHVHPAVTGAAGRSIEFTIPTHGHDFTGDTSYLISLTVTDSDGLQAQDSVEIEPRRVPVRLEVDRSDAALLRVDGVSQQAPFVIDTIVDFQHEIAAPAQSCDGDDAVRFSRWSNGGAREQALTVPTAEVTLTASYHSAGEACTGRPIGTLAAPATAADGTTLVFPGVATDDVSVRRVDYRIRDSATNRYLDPATGTFTSTSGWTALVQPATGTELIDFAVTFVPPTRGGTFRVQARVLDDEGRLSTPVVYDITLANAQPAIPLCLGKPATVVLGPGGFGTPTNGADVIVGTRKADRIDGLGGNDTICGRNGADRIDGGTGNDRIDGGGGADVLIGGRGSDAISGGNGHDLIRGGGEADWLSGDAGDDKVLGGAGSDTVLGADGNDVMRGGGGRDIITGGSGDDTIGGNAGPDILYGADGNDTIWAGSGDDVVRAGAGADTIHGDAGDDVLGGAADFDRCFGGLGIDRFERCEVSVAD